MRTFAQVVQAMDVYARQHREKKDQPFAIALADEEGVIREECYAPADTGILFLDEVRQLAQACVRTGRDTHRAFRHAPRQGQAVILRTHRGRVYGAVAFAGYGSRNRDVADFGSDAFFNRKPRARIALGDTDAKA